MVYVLLASVIYVYVLYILKGVSNNKSAGENISSLCLSLGWEDILIDDMFNSCLAQLKWPKAAECMNIWHAHIAI